MKVVMAERRDPLAHGLGGGVTAIAEHWEPVLAAPEPIHFDSLFKSATRSVAMSGLDAARRRRLFGYVEQSSVIVFARIEALSDVVNEALDKLQAPA
jgi:hypothetical protein